MNALIDTIRKLGEKTKGKINTPIVVGAWAVNLLGHARQTIDFDFMINEDDFEKLKHSMQEINYNLAVKTTMYARFESNDKSNSGIPFIDCLFADSNTYSKMKAEGKEVNIAGTVFILPLPLKIIAMKLHALKYSSVNSRPNDLTDIIALIRIHKIDTSENSIFEQLCRKYGNDEILKKVRNGLSVN